MIKKLIANRYFILFIALINLVLTPLHVAILPIPGAVLTLLNYTIIILASLLAVQRKSVRLLMLITGFVTLSFVWIEFFMPDTSSTSMCRMISTLALFCLLGYILIQNFIDAKEINIRLIFAAMSGYVLIGIIGGVLFEILDYFQDHAVHINMEVGPFDYYYFSFVSIITIGFGDIIPSSSAAKSLTIFLGIISQFYLAIGIALFIGKHLSNKS